MLRIEKTYPALSMTPTKLNIPFLIIQITGNETYHKAPDKSQMAPMVLMKRDDNRINIYAYVINM